MNNWYETAFRKEYLDLYYNRSDEAAKGEAEFAAKAMGLGEGSAVLDVCCGNGRHARALEELGHHVVGMDLSRELLDAAEYESAAARVASNSTATISSSSTSCETREAETRSCVW